jgi:hypothetical protein
MSKCQIGELILGVVSFGVCVVAVSEDGFSLLWALMIVVSLALIFGPLIRIQRNRKPSEPPRDSASSNP